MVLHCRPKPVPIMRPNPEMMVDENAPSPPVSQNLTMVMAPEVGTPEGLNADVLGG
jgi:hypothetical protein